LGIAFDEKAGVAVAEDEGRLTVIMDRTPHRAIGAVPAATHSFCDRGGAHLLYLEEPRSETVSTDCPEQGNINAAIILKAIDDRVAVSNNHLADEFVQRSGPEPMQMRSKVLNAAGAVTIRIAVAAEVWVGDAAPRRAALSSQSPRLRMAAFHVMPPSAG
jgi:hypothetical protein